MRRLLKNASKYVFFSATLSLTAWLYKVKGVKAMADEETGPAPGTVGAASEASLGKSRAYPDGGLDRPSEESTWRPNGFGYE